MITKVFTTYRGFTALEMAQGGAGEVVKEKKFLKEV
jgi:hypothetical protein